MPATEAPTDLETVVGLEVHLQLATERKLFCPCENRFGAPPNTLTCPVCLGLPGVLPRLRPEPVAQAVRLAVALGCEVEETSSWARKSYFYPDLSKGYQITQLDQPLARGGRLAFGDQAVTLQRLHLEEDAGRSTHLEDATGVDFNRAGVPLVELVTEPEVSGAEAAEELLRGLRALVQVLGVSEGRMEAGHLRCDANVSVRPPGAPLGSKVEIKNLNSFRAVASAVTAEALRQELLLRNSQPVAPETRGFDGSKTFPLRGKEMSTDYRYFPDPDLPPVILSEYLGSDGVGRIRHELPEVPERRRTRYQAWNVAPEAARHLSLDPALGDWFEAALEASGLGVGGANRVAAWVVTEGVGELASRGQAANEAPPGEHLGWLVAEVEAGRLSRQAAKTVLHHLWDREESPQSLVESLGLAQVSDDQSIAEWMEVALREDANLVERYRQGEDRLLGHFVGRVMALSAGAANPHAVRATLLRALHGDTQDDPDPLQEPVS